jgi:hemolysin activation/secretion protein
MNKQQRVSSALLITLLGMSGYAVAQESNQPGSGSSVSTQQAIPKPQLPATTNQKVQVKELASPEITIGQAGMAYAINKIKFQGNISIHESLLQSVIKSSKYGSLGKLTLPQMQEICDVVTNYYRQHDFLVAKAVIPEQDITDGSLVIQVLEGRLDGIQVKASSSEKQERIKEILSAQIPDGSVLQKDHIYRAINIAGESTGEVVKVNLEASKKIGGTNIDVQAEELPTYYGSIVGDNFGSASVGKNNYTGNLGFNSLLSLGDKLNLSVGTTNHPELSRRYDLTYQVPVGNDGWSIGTRIWRSTYQIGSDFSSVQPYGYSQAMGVYASYAFTRSENAKSDWRVGYNHVNLTENYLSGSIANPRQTNVVWTDLGGSYADNDLSTAASTTWLINLTAGNIAVDPSSYNYQTQQYSGGYGIFSYQYGREQVINSGISIFGNIRGQTASKNLDSYQKFNLGGPVAVRAYPVGEVTGDDAVLGTVELRYTEPLDFDGKGGYARIAAFYDSAWAKINHNLLSAQTTPNSAVLAGYGLELNVGIGKNLVGRIYAAKESSSNYGASHIDKSKSRVGLQVSLGF